jgi:myosin heavy subunit
MLQAEIALKDEQLADLTKEVEQLRRQAEESGKRAQNADATESQNAELKRAVSKLAPAAKKTVQYAAELEETRRRLAIVEKERNELSKSNSAIRAQTATLKSALVDAQKVVRTLDGERKETVERAKVAKTTAKEAARKNLTIIFASALLCAGAVCGGYAYVRAALAPPAELSEEAAAMFKQYAAEYHLVVERATQNERDKLNAERERLVAERNRYQELNENTAWDKIASYGWLVLIFGGGFVIGVITIVAAFVFRMS